MPSYLAANGPESLIWWAWVGDHLGEIARATAEHLRMTVIAVGFGLLISLPLALAARGRPRLRGVILSVSGVLYTIPSIAMLFLLGPVTGYTTLLTVEVALVSYTLVILVRSVLTGLDNVPPDLVEAARGMGFTPSGLLWRVELPLAVPQLMAGLRIATVSTIGLVTMAALLAQGGLGALILDGINRSFSTPLLVGSVLAIALAVLADLLFGRLERQLSPWRQEPQVARSEAGGDVR